MDRAEIAGIREAGHASFGATRIVGRALMAREDRPGVHLDRPADHEPDRERGGGCERGHQDGAIHPPGCPNHRASSEGSPSIIWPPIAILGPRSRRYARTISSSVGSTTRQA